MRSGSLLLLLLAAACNAGAAEPGVTPAEIVIAQVAPLTGVLSGPNQEGVNGALACFEAVNRRGGVHGRRVTLRQFDDQQKADKSLAITRALIAERAAFAFFMHRTSPTLEKVVPEATRAGYPVVAPQVGPNVVYEPFNPLVFNVCARYSAEVDQVIEYAHSVGQNRIGVFYANDAFGRDNREAAVVALRRRGLKPAAEITFDNRTTDVAPAVALFSSKAQVDMVLMIANAPAAAAFVKGMRAKGASTTFVSLSNTSGDGYVRALGHAGDGVIVTQVVPYPFSDSAPIAREYRKALREAGKGSPSYASLQGYISAKVLVEGLRRSGPNPTQAGFARALESIGDLDLGGYHVAYGPGRHDGSAYVDLTMIKNGKFLR